MQQLFRRALPAILILVFGTLPLSGFAADAPKYDLSANVFGLLTGFRDGEANYWINDKFSVGLVASQFGPGGKNPWGAQNFHGYGLGARVNWVVARDCHSFCLAATARFLHFSRIEINDPTLPSRSYIHYTSNNYFVGFGGMWVHGRLILKAFLGPEYWSNPRYIPAPQSSNPDKRIGAADYGVSPEAEIIVGVNF